jgi:hypothetical protein
LEVSLGDIRKSYQKKSDQTTPKQSKANKPPPTTITTTKKVREHLPSKHQALSSQFSSVPIQKNWIDLTFKDITVHILFNLTQNIHQDTPHSGLSNSTKFKRIKILQTIFSGHNKVNFI